MQVRLEFPFTERDAPDERKPVERDLWTIAQRVSAADPHLRALVLTGGFSRGEGTVHSGRPVNDYDLVAFRARPGGRRLYAPLAHALTEEVGLEVDLMPVWERRVPHLAPKLFWLDLRLGGRVLVGDPALLARIPRFGPRDLPRREIARLLGNRAAGLLLALPGEGELIDVRQRDLQATKAALAALDATLLARGEYAPRLRERLALARGHRDHALFGRAVDWKLGGQGDEIGDRWWDETAAALLRAVDATGARDTRDGALEVCYHLLRARRARASPSQAVRRRAWDLLARSRFPRGPPEWTPEAKKRFFEERARTLQ